MSRAGERGSMPLSAPQVAGKELDYVRDVLSSAKWAGDGNYTARCSEILKHTTQTSHAYLTHSCTAALEMACILADLGPRDEVIMPSFTFVSTANAVALRGATPVFVDIRPDTQNIDESLIEEAITAKTRAIVVVHYAGVCCAMDEINRIASRHGLKVIEDAAHAYLSTYNGRFAGSLGDMAAFSFHETKNVISGEGGAFVTRHSALADRAEIIRDKGTERARFLRGEIPQYSWVDLGSSYLPSELVAAVLCAQLEQAEQITSNRLALWRRYHDRFADIEAKGVAARPVVPDGCGHNGHIYYLLLESAQGRDGLIEALKAQGVTAAFHYLPLHLAPAGLKYGRAHGALTATCESASRIARLPLHAGMGEGDVDRIAEMVRRIL